MQKPGELDDFWDLYAVWFGVSANWFELKVKNGKAHDNSTPP